MAGSMGDLEFSCFCCHPPLPDLFFTQAFLINPFFLVLAILFYTLMANDSSRARSRAVERLVGLAWLQVVCENLFSSLFWKQFVLLLFVSESKKLWLSVYKNRVPENSWKF